MQPVAGIPGLAGHADLPLVAGMGGVLEAQQVAGGRRGLAGVQDLLVDPDDLRVAAEDHVVVSVPPRSVVTLTSSPCRSMYRVRRFGCASPSSPAAAAAAAGAAAAADQPQPVPHLTGRRPPPGRAAAFRRGRAAAGGRRPRSRRAACPAARWSNASLPVLARTTLTDAATPVSDASRSRVRFRRRGLGLSPVAGLTCGGSLSSTMTTCAPRRVSAYSGRHDRAPLAFVVAAAS